MGLESHRGGGMANHFIRWTAPYAQTKCNSGFAALAKLSTPQLIFTSWLNALLLFAVTSGVGGADCPVHGRGGYGYTRQSYMPYTPTPRPVQRSGSLSKGGGNRGSARPRWSPSNSRTAYTPRDVRYLEPVREAALQRTQDSDVFLCHAWPDRQADAKVLYDLLSKEDVSVWFSEVSLGLGVDMRLAIDRGLTSSRIGIVLVTPNMLEKLRSDRSIANSELSALLRRNLLIPVLHGVEFEELDQVSPMLASRGGLSTAEDELEDIAVKIAELINSLDDEEPDELSAD